MSSLLSAYARGTGNRGLPPRIGHQPEAGTRYTYDPTHFSTHIRAYRRTQSAICLHAYRHTPRPVLTRACGGTRDYRAWYGLGQTYEILQMHFYSLYYFRKATALRPYDARMWCAMGQCYECLEKYEEAIKCYKRAYENGDRE
eukprot:741638-Rhodomonas_salina.1